MKTLKWGFSFTKNLMKNYWIFDWEKMSSKHSFSEIFLQWFSLILLLCTLFLSYFSLWSAPKTISFNFVPPRFSKILLHCRPRLLLSEKIAPTTVELYLKDSFSTLKKLKIWKEKQESFKISFLHCLRIGMTILSKNQIRSGFGVVVLFHRQQQQLQLKNKMKKTEFSAFEMFFAVVDSFLVNSFDLRQRCNCVGFFVVYRQILRQHQKTKFNLKNKILHHHLPQQALPFKFQKW